MEAELCDVTESEPINLRSFLDEWLSVLTEDDTATPKTLSLFEFSGKHMNDPADLPIQHELFVELESVCGSVILILLFCLKYIIMFCYQKITNVYETINIRKYK